MLCKYVLRGRGVFFIVVVFSVFIVFFSICCGEIGSFQAPFNMTTVNKQNCTLHLGLRAFRKTSVAITAHFHSYSSLARVQALSAESSGRRTSAGADAWLGRTVLFSEGMTK